MHGLNSTLLSGINGNDNQQDLFMGASQLNVARAAGTVNLIMAHHPPDWMSDQTEIETRLLGAPNIVIFGHKHIQKINRDKDGSISFSAGSVNPDRSESGWEPAYNFIEIKSLAGDGKRDVEISVLQYHWQSNPNAFVPKINIATGNPSFRHKISIKGDNFDEHIAKPSAIPEEDEIMKKISEESDDAASLSAPNVRDLIYRFFELPKRNQRAVLEALNLEQEEATEASELISSRRALVELSKQNRLTELDDAISSKEISK